MDQFIPPKAGPLAPAPPMPTRPAPPLIPMTPTPPSLPPADVHGDKPPWPPSVPGTATHTPRGKKSLFAILIAVIIVLVLGGGAYATYYFDLIKPAPEKVIAGAFSDLQKAKTFHIKGALEASTELPKPNPATTGLESALPLGELFGQPSKVALNVLFEGDVDQTDPKNIKLSSKFDLFVDAGSTVAFGALRGEEALLNGIGYLKVTEVPQMLAAFLNLEPVLNKWWSFDAGALSKELEQKKSEIIVPRNDAPPPLDVQKVVDQLEKLWEKNKPFKLTKDNGTDKSGDRSYELALDKNGMRQFLIDVSHEIVKKDLTSDELKQYDEEGWPAIAETTAQVWIGRRDGKLHRMQLNLPVRVPAELRKASSETPERLQITFGMVYSNYNAPVKIETPTESKGVEELIRSATEQFRGGLQGYDGTDVAPLGGPDTDKDGLADSSESFWGTDPKKADTDGDGFTDKEEIDSGHNPLKRGNEGNLLLPYPKN